MDALSFSLGIAFVVVIAIAVVAVDAFVKVRSAKMDIDNLARELGEVREDIYRNMSNEIEHVVRMLDSRCDKLESKLSNTGSKQILKG